MLKRDKPLVLCIEDEEDIQELLKIQLEAEFELLFAPDGKEGVRLAIFHRPDLILIDLMMPNIDGVEATAMIKSIKAIQFRPLVALTAAPKKFQERALQAGCDLVLEKPALDLPERLKSLLPPPTGSTLSKGA